MAPGSDKKPSRIDSETIWYAIPGLLLVLFFAWVLWEMGSQASGSTLVRMLIGIAVVLGGGALVFLALTRFSNDD
jgi:thiol:disulfide interchange protein